MVLVVLLDEQCAAWAVPIALTDESATNSFLELSLLKTLVLNFVKLSLEYVITKLVDLPLLSYVDAI